MADQSDVEQALVTVIAAALYPAGEGSTSAIGATCRIYRGWPNAAALDRDLAGGTVNITVFPIEGQQQNLTRFPDQWGPAASVPTLTVTATAQSATFAGQAGAGQVAGMLVDGLGYVYRSQAGDTPPLVAATLASAIRADRVAHLSGATITVPTAGRLIARTVADTSVWRELRRQIQAFRVTAWCPTPVLRDAAATLIDPALAAVHFLGLPDGSAGRLRYARTITFDQSQDATLYRRDLVYTVEFPTTQTLVLPAMLFGSLGLGARTILA
jgi:hypothetical protein